MNRIIGYCRMSTEEQNLDMQERAIRERKKWEKLFEGGQPVTRDLTKNNPLEVFHRIRDGQK